MTFDHHSFNLVHVTDAGHEKALLRAGCQPFSNSATWNLVQHVSCRSRGVMITMSTAAAGYLKLIDFCKSSKKAHQLGGAVSAAPVADV